MPRKRSAKSTLLGIYPACLDGMRRDGGVAECNWVGLLTYLLYRKFSSVFFRHILIVILIYALASAKDNSSFYL